MTDKEQKSNAPSAGGSAMVMVEKSSAQSRHTHKAFRPTELPDDTPAEVHHKRSRAPAVPSVAEEYKDIPENADIREQKESKLVMPSEKPSRLPSNKSSKRAKSPEAIAMAPIEMDVQRADIVSPAPAAPATKTPDKNITDTVDIIDKKDMTDDRDTIDNDDSITEEVTDLRISESAHKEWDTANGSQKCVPENQETEDTAPLPRKLVSDITNKIDIETENKKKDPVVRSSEAKIPLQRKIASGTVNEGITSTKRLKKKEITWTQSTYLDKTQLQNLDTGSLAWMLDRRASVGPCFRKTLPYGEPSGIAICLPKKSMKTFNENIKPSKSGGININVSKRCLDINAKLSCDYEMRMRTDRVVFPRKENKVGIKIEEGNCSNFLDNLKGKIDSWRGRIKHVFHM